MRCFHAVALLLSLGFLSCGTRDDDPEANIVTSHEALCAGAAPEYVGGYAVATGCPFIQHAENVAKFGERLPERSALFDGNGKLVARVTHACDVWAVGTDGDGVTVVVRRDRGNVISHGNLHQGEVLTKVSSPLSLPVEIR